MFKQFLLKVARPLFILSFTLALSITAVPCSHAADNATETTYYFLTDHLGDVDVVLDEEGNVVERADYLPYGNDRLRIDNSPSENDDHKFTGKEKDDETGLYYYGARYYDSIIGKFVSQDPWPGDSKDPQTFNKYVYAKNNPSRYIDETGEKASEYQPSSLNTMDYLEGSLLGTYRGIEIRSAGAQTGGVEHSYQCVDLAQRFSKSQYNVSLANTGNAVDYGDQEKISASFARNNKNNPGTYTVYQNGSPVMPKENDIISWSGHGNGHVGFIAEVTFEEDKGEGWVYTLEQNFKRAQGMFYQKLTRNYGETGQAVYKIGDRTKNYPVKAWARYDNQSRLPSILDIFMPSFTRTPHSPATKPPDKTSKK